MRKGEKAKLTIKSKEAFKKDDAKLIIPAEYKDKRDILAKKRVVYEIEIIDFNERYDLNNDGNLMKIILKKGKGTQKPENMDDVCVDFKIEQNGVVKLDRAKWYITVDSNEISNTMRRIVASSRVGEQSKTEVPFEYIKTKDAEMIPNTKLDDNIPVTIYLTVHKFLRSKDVYGDGTTISRTLKSGLKDSHPYFESTVEFQLKVYINDKQVFSNLYLKPLIDQEKYEFLQLEEEEKDILCNTDKKTLVYKLDEYKLPSLIKKMLRECSTNEIVEYGTTSISKLHSVFGFHDIDFSILKEGDRVRLIATVVKTDRPSVLRDLVIAQKKERILFLKGLAGEMFKLNKLKKACKLYQKINGYYNFGDVSSLAKDEKEEEVKPIRDELMKVKLQCFLNTIVCKFKLAEYSNIKGIADQVLEMDPKSSKAFYFTIKAQLALKNYEEAKDWAVRAMKADSTNADLIAAYNEAIAAHKKYIGEEQRKYSKLFG